MQAEPNNFGPSPSNPASAGVTAIPLFHAAWLFAGGIALTQAMWLRPGMVLVALAPVAVLCGFAAHRAQRIAWIPLAVLWFLLGAWCAEMEPHPAPAPTVASLSDGLMRTVEGTISHAGPVRGELGPNLDEQSSDRLTQSIDLRVSSIEMVNDTEDLQIPTGGGVRLMVRWPKNALDISALRAFDCGERVRAVVRLLPPQVYRDPGAWSRADYLLDQGITSTASVGIDHVESLGAATGGSLTCRIAGWQQASSTRLLALPAATQWLPAWLRLSEDDAIMLAAMTTGDRTYLTHSIRVGFERTGSFHMLVVSGFHLAIVAGCIFWMARRLRLPRVPATLITIVASFSLAGSCIASVAR